MDYTKQHCYIGRELNGKFHVKYVTPPAKIPGKSKTQKYECESIEEAEALMRKLLGVE